MVLECFWAVWPQGLTGRCGVLPQGLAGHCGVLPQGLAGQGGFGVFPSGFRVGDFSNVLNTSQVFSKLLNFSQHFSIVPKILNNSQIL